MQKKSRNPGVPVLELAFLHKLLSKCYLEFKGKTRNSEIVVWICFPFCESLLKLNYDLEENLAILEHTVAN